jgi:hypothetical protein
MNPQSKIDLLLERGKCHMLTQISSMFNKLWVKELSLEHR